MKKDACQPGSAYDLPVNAVDFPPLQVVVVHRDEGGFVGICVNHYAAARGASVEDVERRLWGVLASQILADREDGRSPLSTLQPAPDDVRQMFEAGSPINFGPAYGAAEVRMVA
jgi:hypothetical protein